MYGLARNGRVAFCAFPKSLDVTKPVSHGFRMLLPSAGVGARARETKLLPSSHRSHVVFFPCISVCDEFILVFSLI